MTPEATALAAMSTFDQLGPVRMRRLLEQHSAPGVWERLRAGRLDELDCGVGRGQLAKWSSSARSVDLERFAARCATLELRVLTAEDPDWPDVLRHDPDPPLVLFRRGAASVDGPVVAVVGTRRCTPYGRRIARRLGEELAAAGAVVLSGLALGVDAESQRAALDAGGTVIGVVGSGLDVVYPRANRRLWADVAARGQLWSEWGPGTPPARWRFPARNRLVAAMADALVVVESAAAGGSLHTVDAAIERDVPVFVVPGPIDSPASEGTNRLLVQGCAPFTDLDDLRVVVDLPTVGVVSAVDQVRSVEDAALLGRLDEAPATIAELALATSDSLGELAAALDRLEADGHVRCTAGWWERVR